MSDAQYNLFLPADGKTISTKFDVVSIITLIRVTNILPTTFKGIPSNDDHSIAAYVMRASSWRNFLMHANVENFDSLSFNEKWEEGVQIIHGLGYHYDETLESETQRDKTTDLGLSKVAPLMGNPKDSNVIGSPKDDNISESGETVNVMLSTPIESIESIEDDNISENESGTERKIDFRWPSLTAPTVEPNIESTEYSDNTESGKPTERTIDPRLPLSTSTTVELKIESLKEKKKEKALSVESFPQIMFQPVKVVGSTSKQGLFNTRQSLGLLETILFFSFEILSLHTE